MLTEKQAIALLKKHSSTSIAFKKVLAHSKAVQHRALEIAKDKRVNQDFISIAALLHDIGRFQCPPPSKENAIWHGVVGARILRKDGLRTLAYCTERHVGSGITLSEAKKYGLPQRSYLPITLEEKIVCYADSLTFGTKRGTFKQVAARYRREVGEIVVERTKRLRRDIGNSR